MTEVLEPLARKDVPEPPVPARSRITVVDTVYHQASGADPTCAESRFNRELLTDELPYSRQMKLEEHWRPLDHGWMAASGMLFIRNEEGRFAQVVPTAVERGEALRKIVEIGIETSVGVIPFAYVPPGESCRWPPMDVRVLRLRTRFKMAKVTLTLFPI